MPRYPFSPEILDAFPEELAEMFRGLELKLLEEICSRLKIADQLNEVTVQDIRALRSHGVSLEDIKKAISDATDTGAEKLEQLLDDVVNRNQQYYTAMIDLAHVTAPERLVDERDIAAIRRQTWGAYKNITGSMGFLTVQNGRLTFLEPAKAYEWVLDQAALQVQSGAISYNQAIAGAVRQLADSGLCVAYDKSGNLLKHRVAYESGHVDHLDVAVRRAVMTGVNQLNQKYREQSMDYLETDLVEVTAHLGARNIDGPNGWENHAKWQGKVYQLILSLQKEAETAALQELLVQAYKDRYQAVSDAEQAVKKVDAAEQALTETEKKLTDTPWWEFKKHAELTAQQKKQTEALEAATNARDKAVTAYEQLSGAIDTYSGALTDLEEPEASVGVKLEERMNSVRRTVEGVADDMPEYGRNIGEGLEEGMSDGLDEKKTKGIFEKIGDWVRDLFKINSPSKVFEEFGGFLMSGLHEGLMKNLEPVMTFFSGLWEDVRQLASDAWDGIVSVWNSVTSWFNENIIEPLKKFFSEMWEKIKKLASDAWNGIVSVWQAVSGWFNEKIITPVTRFFSDMWEKIRTGASSLWDKIKGVWQSASNWFEQHVTKPIGDAFEAVGDFIKGVFNGVIGTIEGLINSVIRGINWLIEKLNSISFEIPQGVPFVGGTKFGINIPTISEIKLPRLANGAVIPPNQQFAAILGDQRSGMNIEAPLSTIEQALQNVFNRNGGAFGATEVNVNFTGSLSELARILQPVIAIEHKRRGPNMVEVRT